MLPEDYSYEISYETVTQPEYTWIETTNGFKYPCFGGRCNGKSIILSNSEVNYLKADEKTTMEVAKMYWEKSNLPKIKKVIFNYPATIIIWEDKSKTVVKLMDGDTWDPEKGFAMAYLKKLLGTQRLRKEIKTYVKPQEKLESEKIAIEFLNNPDDYLSSIKKALKKIFNIDADVNSAEEENK